MDNRDPDEQYTEQELAELIAWDNTEPGLEQRLALRRAALVRLAYLGAPCIILDNQVRLMREIEEKLLAGVSRGPEPPEGTRG